MNIHIDFVQQKEAADKFLKFLLHSSSDQCLSKKQKKTLDTRAIKYEVNCFDIIEVSFDAN